MKLEIIPSIIEKTGWRGIETNSFQLEIDKTDTISSLLDQIGYQMYSVQAKLEKGIPINKRNTEICWYCLSPTLFPSTKTPKELRGGGFDSDDELNEDDLDDDFLNMDIDIEEEIVDELMDEKKGMVEASEDEEDELEEVKQENWGGNFVECKTCNKVYTNEENIKYFRLPVEENLLIFNENFSNIGLDNFYSILNERRDDVIDLYRKLNKEFLSSSVSHVNNYIIETKPQIQKKLYVFSSDEIRYWIYKGFNNLFQHMFPKYDMSTFTSPIVNSEKTFTRIVKNDLNKMKRNFLIKGSEELQPDDTFQMSLTYTNLTVFRHKSGIEEKKAIDFITLMNVLKPTNETPLLTFFLPAVNKWVCKIKKTHLDNPILLDIRKSISQQSQKKSFHLFHIINGIRLHSKIQTNGDIYTNIRGGINVRNRYFDKKSVSFRKGDLENYVKEINRVILLINRVRPFEPNVRINTKMEKMETDIKRWGTDVATEFISIDIFKHMQIQFREGISDQGIDFDIVKNLFDKFPMFHRLTPIDSNTVEYNYAEGENNQGLKNEYNSALWKYLLENIRNIYDDEKFSRINFSSVLINQFYLDHLTATSFANRWLILNEESIKAIRRNKKLNEKQILQRYARPTLSGITIRIQRMSSNLLYRIHLNGLTKLGNEQTIFNQVEFLLRSVYNLMRGRGGGNFTKLGIDESALYKRKKEKISMQNELELYKILFSSQHNLLIKKHFSQLVSTQNRPNVYDDIDEINQKKGSFSLKEFQASCWKYLFVELYYKQLKEKDVLDIFDHLNKNYVAQLKTPLSINGMRKALNITREVVYIWNMPLCLNNYIFFSMDESTQNKIASILGTSKDFGSNIETNRRKSLSYLLKTGLENLQKETLRGKAGKLEMIDIHTFRAFQDETRYVYLSCIEGEKPSSRYIYTFRPKEDIYNANDMKKQNLTIYDLCLPRCGSNSPYFHLKDTLKCLSCDYQLDEVKERESAHILSANNYPLDSYRFGFLPIQVESIVILINSTMNFYRMGIEDGQICDCVQYAFEETLDLDMTPREFLHGWIKGSKKDLAIILYSLSEGIVSENIKNYSNLIDLILYGTNIYHQKLYSLSFLSIFTKLAYGSFPHGINIFIFKKINDKYELDTPLYVRPEYLYIPNRPYIVLYYHENEETPRFEIVIGRSKISNNDSFIYGIKNPDEIKWGNELVSQIRSKYVPNIVHPSGMSIYERRGEWMISKQFIKVDFDRACYMVELTNEKETIRIPVSPSGILPCLDISLVSYTLQNVKRLIHDCNRAVELGWKEFKPRAVIRDGKKIIGLVLNSNLVVEVKPEEEEIDLPESKKQMNKLYNDDADIERTIEDIYKWELFMRTRIELAHLMKEMNYQIHDEKLIVDPNQPPPANLFSKFIEELEKRIHFIDKTPELKQDDLQINYRERKDFPFYHKHGVLQMTKTNWQSISIMLKNDRFPDRLDELVSRTYQIIRNRLVFGSTDEYEYVHL